MEVKKKRNIWLLILLLLLCLAGYGIYQYFFKPAPAPMSVISGDFLPDGKDAVKMSEQELAALAQKEADKSNFNIMIASEATINRTNQKGQLPIKNPTTNAYPINVEIREDATGKLLYTSGAIYPGEEIKQIQLETPLSAGTHPATANFSLYDAQTKKKQGEVSAGVTILVN